MANKQQPDTAQTVSDLVITRTFDAPVALVFEAWSDAKHLANWWGPKGFDLEVKKLDFRPGGVFHYRMSAANGAEMWGRFLYREIEAPGRIVYTSSFSDAAGNVARAPFDERFPMEVWNEISLTPDGEKTLLTLRGRPLNATMEESTFFQKMFPSMQQGYKGTLDQLVAYLSSL